MLLSETAGTASAGRQATESARTANTSRATTKRRVIFRTAPPTVVERLLVIRECALLLSRHSTSDTPLRSFDERVSALSLRLGDMRTQSEFRRSEERHTRERDATQ